MSQCFAGLWKAWDWEGVLEEEMEKIRQQVGWHIRLL